MRGAPEVGGRRHLSVVNVVDLFCGVGGLSLGAARAGFTVHGAVDVDPKALDAHRRNFPGTVHLSADISELTGQSIKRRLGLKKVDGIIGSPPCQGFSAIGKSDRYDPRNKLFVDFFRIVSETLPKFFLAENVPGMMREKYRGIREKAFSLVGGKYAILRPMKFAANDYGAPTTRRRVFFVGFLKDSIEPLAREHFEAGPGIETVRVRDALRGLPSYVDPHCQAKEQGWLAVGSRGADGGYARRLRGHVPPGVGDRAALRRLRASGEVSGFLGTVHSAEVAGRYAAVRPGKHDPISKSSRLDSDGFCPTLRAGTGPDQGSFQAVRPIHPTEGRVITPREAARLQGFPDWFQFSPTKWHSFRQIGNSVSPILAERVFAVIAGALGAAGRGRVR